MPNDGGANISPNIKRPKDSINNQPKSFTPIFQKTFNARKNIKIKKQTYKYGQKTKKIWTQTFYN